MAIKMAKLSLKKSKGHKVKKIKSSKLRPCKHCVADWLVSDVAESMMEHNKKKGKFAF